MQNDPTEKVLHRIFYKANVLTPVAVEMFTYKGICTYAFLYIFGLRVARWVVRTN